ncbi:MAG: YIP1 family protein [archaeon]|nr:YIP1 family protein [archaeon]
MRDEKSSSKFIKRLGDLLIDPIRFFEEVRGEGLSTAFIFFLKVTTILSITTPIVNYYGIESTDFSSSYQAQIMAYRILKSVLIERYGIYAYLIDSLLILGLACIILILGAFFLHLIYRLIGGKGSFLNAWKSMCYGVGPCILGGFLPYISLFAAFYSIMFQIYIGPKVLYKVKESRAIVLLAIIIALTFIEMFVTGTTVEFW